MNIYTPGSRSRSLVWMYPAAALLFAISIYLLFEDVQTTVAGYETLRTQKVGGATTALVVGLLVTGLQIFFGWIWKNNRNFVWAAMIASFAFAVDQYTDVWYKSAGMSVDVSVAFVEALILFTLGAEYLFTMTLSFLILAFGDFIEAFMEVFTLVANGVWSAADKIGAMSEDAKSQYQQRQGNR